MLALHPQIRELVAAFPDISIPVRSADDAQMRKPVLAKGLFGSIKNPNRACGRALMSCRWQMHTYLVHFGGFYPRVSNPVAVGPLRAEAGAHRSLPRILVKNLASFTMLGDESFFPSLGPDQTTVRNIICFRWQRLDGFRRWGPPRTSKSTKSCLPIYSADRHLGLNAKSLCSTSVQVWGREQRNDRLPYLCTEES
jgi:hypothetical protein